MAGAIATDMTEPVDELISTARSPAGVSWVVQMVAELVSSSIDLLFGRWSR